MEELIIANIFFQQGQQLFQEIPKKRLQIGISFMIDGKKEMKLLKE